MRNANHLWRIGSLDPQVVLDLAGYTDGVDDSASPVLAGSGPTPGTDASVAFVGVGPRRVRFRTRFVGEYNGDSLASTLERLRALRTVNPVLGRAPRVQFSWGLVRIAGLAESADIRIVGLWPNGTVREIAAEIAIVASSPIAVQTVDPSAGETLYTPLREGETFESLGQRLWGDPLRGDLIRRENPELAAGEEAGDLVRVLEREHPRSSGEVRPVAAPLVRLRDGSTPWRDLVDQLGRERGSAAGQLGLSWDRLPEVLAGEV